MSALVQKAAPAGTRLPCLGHGVAILGRLMESGGHGCGGESSGMELKTGVQDRASGLLATSL
eukprot:1207794-Alexandrium_andersonii.AAC.1